MNLLKDVSNTFLPQEEKANYNWWFGTYNNPPKDWKGTLDAFQADFCIGQLEKGNEGTEHIQFLLYFKSTKRPSAWRGCKCWIKGVTAPDAQTRIAKYVSKETTRLEGPYQYGTEPGRKRAKRDCKKIIKAAEAGKYEDLDDEDKVALANVWVKLVQLNSPWFALSDCCGLWITGPKGYGKTFPIFYPTLDDSNGPDPDVYDKDGTDWWDGYVGQKTVLFDDMDPSHSRHGHNIKKWADRYRRRAQVKGGYVSLLYTRFIVTSNYLPSDIWRDDEQLLGAIMRRFKFRVYYKKFTYVDGVEWGEIPDKPEDYIYT